MAKKTKKKSTAEDEWWTATSPIGQSVYLPTRDKKLREKRPHSTPEGRWADVKRMFGGKSGGRATHGYGKAYMKGGKVK